MPDRAVRAPYFLVNGDQEARGFLRADRDPSLAAANQYVQGDLVYVHTDGTVRKAVAGAASLGKLTIAGQDYSSDHLPPDDPNSSAAQHWLYERGVPLNKIFQRHECVFNIRGGSGAAAADDTDYTLTAADIVDVKEGTQVSLFYDPTEGVLVADLSLTANPNVELIRLLERNAEAGDLNALVVARILPDFLRA